MNKTTRDKFLGGKLELWQPLEGYRAGVDPVLLAASVQVKRGQNLLDIGCGVGTAALCVGARVKGVSLIGVEIQPEYAALAQRNAVDNGQKMRVYTADLRNLPLDLRQTQFNQVIMNPPYFDRTKGSTSNDTGRDIAFGGSTPLSEWIDAGIRRLAPGGYLTLIQRMDRLPDVITSIESRLGSIVVKPIVARSGRSPERFLLRGRHSGRAAFQMASALIMHEGVAHAKDVESYTPHVRSILRAGAPLDITS